VLKLLLDPGDAVINCPPTFGVYSFAATVNRGRVIDVPRNADFSLDVAAIERGFETGEFSGAKALIVCSPNNPDGGQGPQEEIERLLRLPVIVILDEAYVDFSGGSMVDRVADQPNLIVLRTFSKWLGLAGLRIGYAVLPLPFAQQLWKIKPPFNVNVASQIAALASLSNIEHLDECRHLIMEERDRMIEALSSISYLEPHPTATNFVLARVVGRPSSQVVDHLEGRGILVRHFREPELADHLRISVGLPEETDALIRALREIES
jgi:histidinol-phosphate aminotransferase